MQLYKTVLTTQGRESAMVAVLYVADRLDYPDRSTGLG